MTEANIRNAQIELQHIKIEIDNNRTEHLRHFIDQYYCYSNNYVTSGGKPKWELMVWNENEEVSVAAKQESDRKKVVKEHVIPLNVITQTLKKLAVDSDYDTDVNDISKILDKMIIVATITKEEDARLSKLGYKSEMPEEYNQDDSMLYQEPFARYLKAGIELL